MVGLAWTIVFFLTALAVESDLLPLLIPGFITFLVGLGVVINGLLFTIPRKKLPGGAQDAPSQRVLDSKTPYEPTQLRAMTNELAQQRVPVSSITDHTTHHLNSKKS